MSSFLMSQQVKVCRTHPENKLPNLPTRPASGSGPHSVLGMAGSWDGSDPPPSPSPAPTSLALSCLISDTFAAPMSNLASPRRTDRWLDGSSAAPELHPLRVAWLPPCCSAGVLSGQPGRAGHAPAILSCSPQMQLFSSISSHHHLRPRGLASGTALKHSLLASWTFSDSPSLPPLPLPELCPVFQPHQPSLSCLLAPDTTHNSSF